MDGGNNDGGGADHGHDHGHNHGHQSHGTLAQFLGLDDHDHGQDHGHDHGHDHGEAPQQTGVWNSALKGMSLKTLTQGLVITPNFLFFCLFAAFTGWLGVIYWIRHNEPFANQVVGGISAYAPTAHFDRKLIGSAREALPIKTTKNSGIVYTPAPANMPQGYNPSTGDFHASAAQPMVMQASTTAHMQPALRTFAASSPGAMPPTMLMSNPQTMPQGSAHPSLRSFSNQAQMATQLPQSVPQPMPIQAQQPGWSLANGHYSQDTAVYESQFGHPQQGMPGQVNSSASVMAGQPILYVPVAAPDGGHRLKVFTAK